MAKFRNIVYYDFNQINHSSFFLNGFIENQIEYGFNLVVKRGTPELLKGRSRDSAWQKNLFVISLFETEVDGERFFFCIDTHDSCLREEGYNVPILKQVKYYFKANYNATTIAEDPLLRSQAHKICPTTPFFPLKLPVTRTLIPRLFPNADTSWSLQDVRLRISQLRTLSSLDQLKNLRTVPRNIDVFFVVTHYANQAHTEVSKMRYKLVSELVKHPRINAIAGLISNEELPQGLAHLRIPRFDQKTYFNHLARARISIYVRGPHECISYKFGEYFALGKPIIGQKVLNNVDILYDHPYFREQFAYEEPDTIIDAVERLLQEPDKMAALQKSNSDVFDSCFTPCVAISDILSHISNTTPKTDFAQEG